jgi:DNA-binding transcriptional regulator PaaX
MTTKAAINSALGVLGVAGLAGVTIVAPNAAQGLALLLKKSPAKNSDYKRILGELKRQGLVHIIQNDEQWTYMLTPAGAHRLQRVVIDSLNIPKPAKWDKKWRLVTFDVPIRQSKARAYFTSHLQSLGFMMLQRSLWVHPFPSFDQVEQIGGYYNVLRYCTLMEVDRLDELSTRKLLRHFNAIL